MDVRGGTSLLEVRSATATTVVAIAIASYGGLVVTIVAGWPLWARVLGALLPWTVLLARETAWLRRHHGMLALFYLLVVTQGGHLLEHLVQFLQANAFGLRGEDASGVFSALDTEWVHFVWNTWVLAATIPLVWRYRTNRWLWLAAVAAVWHEVEHAFLIVEYVRSGVQGNPGLLAAGGAVSGGLPVPRIDLHFYYNLVETLPLLIAFTVALRTMRAEQRPDAAGDLPSPGSGSARAREPLGVG